MAAINIVLEALDKYSAVLTGLNQGLELVGKTVKTIGVAADLATGGIGLVFKALTSVAGIALSPITFAFDAMYNSVILVKDAVYSLFGYLWDGIKSAASFTWDTIKSLSGYLYDSFKDALGYIWDSIKELNSFALTTTKDFVTNFAKSLYDTGNTFEQLQVRMEAVFGSSGAAKAALDWAVEFGAKTPLTLDQVASAMVKLKTFGFDPMDGTLQKLGDAAFALGTDFDGVVTALGQMQLKGKVSAEELMQLAERNVPVYEILRQKFNLTAEQLGNIGKVGLDVNEAVKAIVDGLGTRFTGAMEKASGTAQGALSTIEDTWMVFQKRIADSGAWDQVTSYIIKIRDYLGSVLGGFSGGALAGQVGEAISYVLKYMQNNRFAEGFIQTIMSVASDSIQGLRSVAPEILESIKIIFEEGQKVYAEYIGNITKAIKTIAPVINDVIRDLPSVRAKLAEAINYIVSLFGSSVPKTSQDLRKLYADLKAWGEGAIKSVKAFVEELQKAKVPEKLYDTLIKVKDTIVNIYEIGKNIISGIDWNKVLDYIYGKLVETSAVIKNVYDVVANISKSAYEIISGVIDNLPEIKDFLGKMFNAALNSLFLISDFVFDFFSNTLKAAKGVGSSLLDIFFGLTESIEAISDITNDGIDLWRTYSKVVNGIFYGIFEIAGQVFDSIFGKLSDGINGLKNALAQVAPDLASKIPDVNLRINDSDAMNTIKGMFANNLMLIADDELLQSAEKAEKEMQKRRLKAGLDKISVDFGDTGSRFDEIKDSFKDMFDFGVSGIAKAGDYLRGGADSMAKLDELSTWQIIKLDDGSLSAINHGIAIAGNVPKIELDAEFAKLNAQLSGKGKIEFEKIDIKDKKIGIDVDDTALDKLKGEVLVSLKDDAKIQSGLNENEILLALTKLLKAQLVADATGEGLPVITYS